MVIRFGVPDEGRIWRERKTLPRTANSSDDEVKRMEGPLEGIRVLDVSIMLAGPLVGRVLQDLGAEVIKIESPDGDPGRVAPPRTWCGLHRGQSSVRLDLKQPAGVAVLEE